MNSIIYETITSCRICNSNEIEQFLDMGPQPPANSLRAHKDADIPLIPLRLLFCPKCKVVQLGESVDPEYLFSKYVWVTGTSKGAKHHSKFFFQELSKRNKKVNSKVLEIASNDGTFLKQFKDAGDKILGVDPAKNIAQIANDNGIPTISEFFSESFAQKLKIEKEGFDVIFARNVLPHVKNIHSVISGISLLLETKGVGAIEFHDASLILEELHYDSIYHEHLFYFSLKTLSHILSMYDLEVFDLVKSPISGGSWVIYFSKEKRVKTDFLINRVLEEEKNGVNTIEKWKDFAQKTRLHAKDLVSKLKNFNGKLIGYGASARSSTLLNFCKINKDDISYIIDNNVLKQNLITPGSDINIVSKKQLFDDKNNVNLIVLLAWNFKSEIIEEIKSSGYKGKIIIPLPNKVDII